MRDTLYMPRTRRAAIIRTLHRNTQAMNPRLKAAKVALTATHAKADRAVPIPHQAEPKMGSQK